MPDSLDCATHLLHPSSQSPQGLMVQAAPRKAARGRERDTLLLCLGLRSRVAVSADWYEEYLELAARTFFGTPGSVTAALRQALSSVNQRLLDANLKVGAGPVQGGLIGAVLRGMDFYAVQCGPGLVLVARGLSVERFPTTAGRPLGLSNTLDPHYFHTTVAEGEYVSLSPAAPADWNEITLAGLGNLATLTHVAERLQETAPTPPTALIVRFEREAAGAAQPAARLGPTADGLRSGLSALLRSRVEPAVIPPETPVAPEPEAAEPEAVEPAQPEAPSASLSASAVMPVETPPAPAPLQEPPPVVRGTNWSDILRRSEQLGASDPAPRVAAVEDVPLRPPAPAVPVTDDTEDSESAVEDDELEPAGPTGPGWIQSAGERLQHGVRSVGRAVSVTLSEAMAGVRRLTARALPEGTLQREGLFEVPPSALMGIALLTPVIVVTIGLGLYFQEGRTRLYQDAVLLAQSTAAQARTATDPQELRRQWEDTLTYIAQAESIQPNSGQLVALQREAQAQLDQLDTIVRLDYQPLVVGGLGTGITIKRLSVFGSGQATVYALDETNNRVLRLEPTTNNTGYAIDRGFRCSGGGRVGVVSVGTLVDLLPMPDPTASGRDSLVVMDNAGAVLYCAPGLDPLAGYLVVPPTGWQQPMAFQFYERTNSLYILDPSAQQIWRYAATGGAFTTAPEPYFNTVNYDLTKVVDFAIAVDGTLYLLYQDGSVTICSGATACQPQASFTDPRPGRQSGPLLQGVSRPVALTASHRLISPPTLYLLDGATASAYRIGLGLLFDRQFRPRGDFQLPVEALAFDALGNIYAASGDNVYRAQLP